MTVQLIDGVLKIDRKEVLTVVFTDGSSIRFPLEDQNEILVADGASNSANATGRQNTVISGKNVIAPGTVINAGGSFRLGDG